MAFIHARILNFNFRKVMFLSTLCIETKSLTIDNEKLLSRENYLLELPTWHNEVNLLVKEIPKLRAKN